LKYCKAISSASKYAGRLAFWLPLLYIGAPLLLFPFSFSWIYGYVIDAAKLLCLLSLSMMLLHSLHLVTIIFRKRMFGFLVRFLFFHIFFHVFALYLVYYRVNINEEDLDMSIFR